MWYLFNDSASIYHTPNWLTILYLRMYLFLGLSSLPYVIVGYEVVGIVWHYGFVGHNIYLYILLFTAYL